MRKGILFLNGSLGLNVLNFILNSNKIKLLCLVINEPTKRTANLVEAIQNTLKKNDLNIPIYEYQKNLWTQTEFNQNIKFLDFGVSALFGHKIPMESEAFSAIRILNLHPSLLPLGKGADPIPWSIIEKRDQGVTIHEVDSNIDTGPTIYQEKIMVDVSKDAGEIYEIACEKLFQIFKLILDDWLNGKIEGKPQIGHGTLHESSELRKVRIRLQEDATDFEQFIRMIKALTYSDGRKAILKLSDGQSWEVQICMRKI